MGRWNWTALWHQRVQLGSGQPEGGGDESGGFHACVRSSPSHVTGQGIVTQSLLDMGRRAGELVRGSGAVSPSLPGL